MAGNRRMAQALTLTPSPAQIVRNRTVSVGQAKQPQTVNRQVLTQALSQSSPQLFNSQNLQTGRDISNLAMNSSNFGSGQAREVGLAAQLATAGIGAYTQYRAQKDINEQELSSQAQFSKQFPHLADIASTLSPETRQAYTLEAIKASLKTAEPQSSFGKISADYNAGLIDEPTYRAALKKESSFAPDSASSGGATGAIVNNLRRENPNLSYAQALTQAQGLARQGLGYDASGNVAPVAGFVESQQAVKGSAKQAENLAAKSSEKLIELGDKADEANMTLTNNTDARKLLDSGVYTGSGANYKLALGKGLQTAGISLNDDPIANTEAFTALRAQEVGRQIKQFGAGTGLSDADREYATKMAAGQITLSDKSIRKILDISDKSSNNVINLYNKKAGKLPSQVQQYAPQIQSSNSEASASGGFKILNVRDK